MENTPTIKVYRSCYRTINVFLYNITDDVKAWFSMMDVWGSQGYDRFKDGGIFYELPNDFYDLIQELPFIKRKRITVEMY